MRSASRTSWKGTDPVWLLQITWAGHTYRFSSKIITLTDSLDNVILFEGGLEQPALILKSDRLGVDVEANSLPVAITFAGVNVAAQHMKGILIDNAAAELSYVLDSPTDPATSLQERVIVLKGVVSQPVYGHPDRNKGYCEFSIEQQGIIDSTPLIESLVLDAVVDTDLLDAAEFTTVGAERDIGKTIPILLGTAGTTLRPTAVFSTIYPMPCYYLGASTTSLVPSGVARVFTHSALPTGSTGGTIIDSRGTTKSYTVTTARTSANELFECILIDDNDFDPLNTAPSTGNLIVPTDDSTEYYISPNAGGIESPFSAGTLTGAGDVCMWALSSTANVDLDAWGVVRPFLNQYLIAGAIADLEITGLQFLKAEILPYLPVSLVQGTKGIKPMLNLLVDRMPILPKEHITAGGTGFFRSSPITTISEPEDLINQITLRYAWNSYRGSYSGLLYFDSKRPIPAAGAAWNQLKDQYSSLSEQRVGYRQKTYELNFVYDYATACRIGIDLLRFHSIPLRTIKYTASASFGWLDLGDIVELTDEDLGINAVKVQILEKAWIGNMWEFTLQIEENPILNRRIS
jgi:hypothetical protein